MEKIADVNVKTPHGATITALYETEYWDGNFAVVGIFDYGDEVEENAISVNIPDQAFNLIGNGDFFLKSWSEREGMLEALLEAGIITHNGGSVRTGYVTAPLVRLNVGKYKE